MDQRIVVLLRNATVLSLGDVGYVKQFEVFVCRIWSLLSTLIWLGPSIIRTPAIQSRICLAIAKTWWTIAIMNKLKPMPMVQWVPDSAANENISIGRTFDHIDVTRRQIDSASFPFSASNYNQLNQSGNKVGFCGMEHNTRNMIVQEFILRSQMPEDTPGIAFVYLE